MAAALTFNPARLAGSARLASRPAASSSGRRHSVVVAGAFTKGVAVRVKESVKVYHVPKTGGAETDLKGLEGVVFNDVSEFKGAPTSATIPIQVKFEEPAKFLAHLTEDELEIVE